MTSGRQLPLELPARRALGRADFLVTPANAGALRMLDDWRNWPEGKCLLTGPEGSGKTHLAQVWAAQTGADIHPAHQLGTPPQGGAHVIEDLHRLAQDRGAQEQVFHWHGAILSGGGQMLLTGRGPLSAWGITLPDLLSRLAAAPVASLNPPDDALLEAVLVKLFDDRHILPPADLPPYLAARIERSFAAAARIVTALDRAALSSGRKLGVRLARDILAQAEPDG